MKRQRNNNNNNKKKRRKLSSHLYETESLDTVPSPIGPIVTPILSDEVKKILLDRFQIEIIDKFKFYLSKKVKHNDNVRTTTTTTTFTDKNDQGSNNDTHEVKKERTTTTTTIGSIQEDIATTCLRQHIVVGTNQCTRALEQQIIVRRKSDTTTATESKPSVLMLARDVRPPTMLAHIPLMCQRLNIPILLLPGKASSDLGQMLGIKSVSVMLFFQKTPQSTANKKIPTNRDETNFYKRYNSFVNFALSKVPSEGLL